MPLSRPSPIQRVLVVVPAANEQDQIDRCLDAIEAAASVLSATDDSVLVRTTLVLDCCTDRTGVRARQHRNVDVIDCTAGRVGAARAAGIRFALHSVATPLDRIWIANTDADSCVPTDWLQRMVRFGNEGANLVLGTVLPDDKLPDAIRQRWLSRHALTDGHRHIHGANLGIRADTYASLGGFRRLASSEDRALVRRAEHKDLSIVRTSAIPVRTSSRLLGRAPGGFATYLATLTLATFTLATLNPCHVGFTARTGVRPYLDLPVINVWRWG